MTDKIPPRAPPGAPGAPLGAPGAPLGAPGERTIIRPSPGGRRPVAPSSSPDPHDPAAAGASPKPLAPQATPYAPPATPGNPNPDEWIASSSQPPQAQPQAAAPDIRIDELVAANENPILRSAGPLLMLLGRLRVALARASFASLMEMVADAIKFFEKDIRSSGVSEAHANAAKYIICATADDIVQNIPTEDRHVWTQYSMLSRFFGERIGGVRFFDELTRLKQDPLLNYDVLELQHTCLALGFQGIHRTSAGGVATLQQIQRDLYETLRRVRPKATRELSPRWQGQKLAQRNARVLLPWWAVLGIAGLALFGVYFLFLYWLSGDVDIAANDMTALHGSGKLTLERKVIQPTAAPPPPPPPPEATAPTPVEPERITQMQRICKSLASEVAADKASAEQTANVITVRVGNVLLFESGFATVLDQFKPIAKRVAETLEKEEGYIKVIGHTDNVPITSSRVRFPSNYQLSIERAKNVAALFKPLLTKPERLQTDGKGESAPVADNATSEGRAKNRRVEIVIPRTDTGPVSERTCPR
jgi:type VI secretion system protein ImpK